MSMNIVGDITHSVKYKAADGTEKRRYTKCGTLFQRDDGSFSVRLEAVPVVDYNGWLSVYPPRDRNQNQPNEPVYSSTSEPGPDGDIPF